MKTHPNKKFLHYIFIKTKEALDRISVPFFITHGTCLGYYRDKDFIEWDHDLDIGIWFEDWKPEIKDAMGKCGFRFNHVEGGNIKAGRKEFYKLKREKKIKQELGFDSSIGVFPHHGTSIKTYHRHDDCFWTAFWINRYRFQFFNKRFIWIHKPFILKEVKFKNLCVKIPHPTEVYLKELYGDDWEVPKKHCQISLKNLHAQPVLKETFHRVYSILSFNCFKKRHEKFLKELRLYGGTITIGLYDDLSLQKLRNLSLNQHDPLFKRIEGVSNFADRIFVILDTNPIFYLKAILCNTDNKENSVFVTNNSDLVNVNEIKNRISIKSYSKKLD